MIKKTQILLAIITVAVISYYYFNKENPNHVYGFAGLIAILVLIGMNKNSKNGDSSEKTSDPVQNPVTTNLVNTNNSYPDMITPSDNSPYGVVELTNYYADWCPASKQFLPIWNEFCNQVRIEYPYVKIVPQLCEGPEESKCFAASISGYPTMVLNVNGKKTNFEGTRNIVTMMTWLKNNLETAGIY